MPCANNLSPAETIDVCVCTFRRESIADTLRSIRAQRLPAAVTVRVIIADNDSTDHRRDKIEEMCRSLSLDHLYVHAPEKNISRARNACLAHACSRWIALIDDDEFAHPDWLARFIAARDGVHCVFGAAHAIYPSSAPRWMIEGNFHSHAMSPREALSNGSTCNAFIDRKFVTHHSLHFREELGQVGGEDTMFFNDMLLAGAQFRYAPDAIVEEHVAFARANLKWLARRRFRAGQIHYLLLRRSNQGRVIIAASAAAKITYCAGRALVSRSRRERMGQALRGSLHAGVLASAIGAPLYREYG